MALDGLVHLVQRFDFRTGFEMEPCPGVPGEDERTQGAEGRLPMTDESM